MYLWNDQGKLSDAAKKQINECGELEALFDLWQQAQAQEPANSYRQTVPIHPKSKQSPACPDFKTSFCRDGMLNDSDVFNGVLIVSRESNVTDSLPRGQHGPSFWLRDNIQDDNNRYVRFCRTALEALGQPPENVAACAYMNINKRGGYGAARPRQWQNYFKQYYPFIVAEIALLKPQYIVCGGVYGTLEPMFSDAEAALAVATVSKVLDCHHPSAPRLFVIKDTIEFNK